MHIAVEIALAENGIQAVKEAMEPTIRFTLDCTIDHFTFIYSKKGELWLGTKKLCTLAETFIFSRGMIGELNWDSSKYRNKKLYPKFTLEGVLSKSALELLEGEREKHPKGNVEFKLQIELLFFVGTHEIDPQKLVQNNNQPLPFVKLRHNEILFEVHNAVRELPIKIPSSDWIADFMPIFGLDKIVVYELPVLVATSTDGNFGERMAAAMEALDLMEIAKKRADWNGVIKESRPVWELVRDKDYIKNLFLDNGFNEDATKEIQDVIFHFFEFSSKFIHRVPRGGGAVMDSLLAQKEDALLIYTMSLNILNSILAKIRRRGN